MYSPAERSCVAVVAPPAPFRMYSEHMTWLVSTVPAVPLGCVYPLPAVHVALVFAVSWPPNPITKSSARRVAAPELIKRVEEVAAAHELLSKPTAGPRPEY